MVKFCGKILDGDGYHFDPSCMESLKHLELPTDAGQLNQLLCAMNWMRNVVPHYAELVDPLRQIMETIFAKRGNRRSNGLEKFQLRSFGWNETHNALLKGLVEKICEQMTLYYPDPERDTISIFPDASKHAWGVTITAVENWRGDVPVADLDHLTIAFFSGTFRGAEYNRGIQDKEAFAIMESVRRMRWLTMNTRFKLYCDNRNLTYIFHPEHFTVGEKVPTMTKERLTRWATELSEYSYDLIHIPGELNVWADILSRWGHPDLRELHAAARSAVLHPLQSRIARLTLDDFWNRGYSPLIDEYEPPSSMKISDIYKVSYS